MPVAHTPTAQGQYSAQVQTAHAQSTAHTQATVPHASLPAAGQQAAIQVCQVTKRVGRSKDVTALNKLCLEVQAGEFLAIIGPSGSGKSTLLALLGLLDTATSGTITIAGQDVSKLSERQRNALRQSQIGFVFQSSFVIAEETALENAQLALRIQGISRGQRQAKAAQALGLMGLANKTQRRSGDLSGGERQRVALARAMVTHPAILLADEPTGALDSATSQSLIDLLRQIASQGTTVIVVTHDPAVAASADRTLEIIDGSISSPHCSHTAPSHTASSVPGQGDSTMSNRSQTPSTSSLPARSPMPRHRSRPSSPRSRRSQRPHTRWRSLGFSMQTAFDRLFVQPVKSLTIALAYCLGIAALVLSVGLTQSATGNVVEALVDASTNVLAISTTDNNPAFCQAQASQSSSSQSEITQPASTQSAISQLAGQPGIDQAFPWHRISWQDLPITRLDVHANPGGPRFEGTILVTTPAYLQLRGGLEVTSGSLDLLENSWDGPTAVLGSTAANRLGLDAVGQGMDIMVGTQRVPVIAILASAAQAQDLNNAVLLSTGAVGSEQMALAESRVMVVPELGRAEPLAAALPLILNPASPGSIIVSTPSRLADLQEAVTDNLTSLLGYIAATILSLSALTAATVMYLSVQHRSHEIALRRALGDSRLGIWRQFTMEGLLLGCTGGIAGALLGVLATLAIAGTRGWTPAIGTTSSVQGLGIGLAIGAIASCLPALHAAHQPPAAILRST